MMKGIETSPGGASAHQSYEMDVTQKTAFLTGGEGDAYFDRNGAEFDAGRDPVVMTLAEISSSDRNILEIGCGHGGRVAALVRSNNATGSGVDPSSKQSSMLSHIILASITKSERRIIYPSNEINSI
jgi:hypothetical protein